MHEPDDDFPGSGGDWNGLSPSPSISSLSSFSPEDDYHHSSFNTQPTQQSDETAPETPSQSHSPRVSAFFSRPSLIPRPKSQSPTKPPSPARLGATLLSRSQTWSSGSSTIQQQQTQLRDDQRPAGMVRNNSSNSDNSNQRNHHHFFRSPTPPLSSLAASPTPTKLSGVGLGLHQHMGMVGGQMPPTPFTPQHHQQLHGWYLYHRPRQASGGARKGNRVGFAADMDEMGRREAEGGSQEVEADGNGHWHDQDGAEGHGQDGVEGHEYDDADDEGESAVGGGSGEQGVRWAENGEDEGERERLGMGQDHDHDHDIGGAKDHEQEMGQIYGHDRDAGDAREHEQEMNRADADPAHPDDLPPGARVDLMERLCDLVQRLSVGVGGEMETDVIDVLHAKVDEMEELLLMAEDISRAEAEAEAEAETVAEAGQATPVEAASPSKSEARSRSRSRSPSQSREEVRVPEPEHGQSSAPTPQPYQPRAMEQGGFGMAPPPSWLMAPAVISELAISPTHSHPELAAAATNQALEAAKEAAQAQAEAAERVAVEAADLSCKLEKVVKSLLARKEESDHLHSILLERAEAAASRILDLEKEVTDLEDDILANESELRHLRLKLRAVETLCHELVPPGADPDLLESIENWKADWVLVRDRMRARKKDRKERRLRLHRAGSLIDANAHAHKNDGHGGEGGGDGESTITSLGGLSMSVSLFGVHGKRSPRKGIMNGE